jgi:oxygen-independent coproporphyrinogen-3 oxidase
LQHYEVSNYAVSGQESRHNLAYWNSDDYIGIGAGAHGRLRYKDGQRYELQSIFNPKQWNENVANGGNGLEVEHALTEYEQAEEILIMGLRTKWGIDLEDIRQRFGFDLRKYLDTSKLAEFAEQKLVTYDNKRLKLTYQGVKVLDDIIRKININ